MATPAWWVAAERDLVRQLRPGLPVEDLQRRVLSALRRHVTVDAAFFATADPDTLLMTGAVTEEPLASAAGEFLRTEYALDDVNPFRALAVARAPVATLDAATRADRAASARYREVMRPLGLGGTKSLQDLFTDRKVPRERRHRLPVVWCAGEVAWIPGVATGERFRATPASRETVRLGWRG